jgi:hypothetical protein
MEHLFPHVVPQGAPALNALEYLPFPLVASMVVGALLIVPVLGWWPLVGIIAAIISSTVFIAKLTGGG